MIALSAGRIGHEHFRPIDLRAFPKRNLGLHYTGVVALSLLIGLLYIHPPGFGDELTYWSLSFDLHEVGLRGWNANSFHDLRWPVWGVSWLWQCVFGAGLASFYAGPIFYVMAAAVLAFTFGRLVLKSPAGGWLCAVAFMFTPLLDQVIYRPMPDLSENVFGGCALLGWWIMMDANSTRRAWLAGIGSGAAIGIGYSNRVTGLFIAIVLAVATVLFRRRQWKWLLIPAITALLFFLVECAVYRAVCGDWLHSLHANLNGAWAKDVEVTSLWRLPFRYLNCFFHGNRLAAVYSVLALFGLWFGWTKGEMGGRLLVVWAFLLYLIYSCTIQSLHPVLPLIGSTTRYVASMALPVSLLTALGVWEIWRLAGSKMPRLVRQVESRPLLTSIPLVVLIAFYSSRPFFDLGFATELRRYMSAVPSGTRIFSHHAMRDVAFLVDASAAKRYIWTAPKAILSRRPELEAAAAGCGEFWMLRKHVWLVERKTIEHNGSVPQPQIGSYIEAPEENWRVRGVLADGDSTDIELFSRRRPGDHPAHVLTAGSPELGGVVPGLPLEWSAEADSKVISTNWNIPGELRGKNVTVVTEGSSPTVEPLNVSFDFLSGTHRAPEVVVKPIFYRGGGKDFFAFKIPETADRCRIQLRFAKGASHVRLSSFRAIYEDVP